MKYAREVIDLLAAFPGREFRVAEITRHAARGRKLTAKERERYRRSVWRVLLTLAESGYVGILPADKSGAAALYWWRDRNIKLGKSMAKSETIAPGNLPPQFACVETEA